MQVRIRRIATMMAAALALAACKADDKVLQTWLGAPEAKLMSVWGAPSNVVQTQQGTRILTYRKEGGDSDLLPTGDIDLLPASGPDAREAAYCETTFTVKDYRIVGFSYSGSGC